ncbi:hypothetical protein A3F65_02810 [Candidatus Saccharibacteria bacterium RIFCSPHIGHO2_12_FULL_47_16b]|nr:MAG: hypothetical protein A3F65_02810 [Candidatus Saccharibacteria bacterium RIFCSPHIGHO2_12_FULL_47_16b]
MAGLEIENVDLSLYNRQVGRLAAALGRTLYLHAQTPEEPLPADVWATLDTYLVVEKGIDPEDSKLAMTALDRLVAHRR